MMHTGLIGGALADQLLRHLGERAARKGYGGGSAYRGRSKLEVLFGESIWRQIAGAVVADFGCGAGEDAVEMAQQGAARVIGIDILDHSLLIRWRSRFMQDGATRYAEVEGAFNRMTLRRFRRLVARSPLRFETFETIPIRRLRVLANRLTQNSSPPPCAAPFGGGM